MADPPAAELLTPSGARLRIEWDPPALADLRLRDETARPWRLEGDLDAAEVEALRILSGRLAPQRTLAIASLRPGGAGGHGEDVSAGFLGDPEGFERLEEVLLSTEFGADGRPRRIGLELLAPGAEIPVRVAGDARPPRDGSTAAGRESFAFDLRCGGEVGMALLEVLRPT